MLHAGLGCKVRAGVEAATGCKTGRYPLDNSSDPSWFVAPRSAEQECILAVAARSRRNEVWRHAVNDAEAPRTDCW